MEEMVKVRCILESGFDDKETGEYVELGQELYVPYDRAMFLKGKKAVEIIKDEFEELEEPRRRRRRSFKNKKEV